MKKIELIWWVLAVAWIVMGILQLVNGNFTLAVIDLFVGILIAILVKEVELKE